jgi:protein ImuB
MFACIHAPGIAASGIAREFSPLVEDVDASTVVLDVSGLGRLLGTAETIAGTIAVKAGPMAHVAVASTRDAALYAAQGIRGVTVIAPGEEARVLGGLPVEIVATGEILDTLDRWGIRTLHELAALPEIGVAERLGPEGVRLRKLARGEISAPLRRDDPAPEFAEALELEDPVELLEPLLFVLSRLLHQLCERLDRHALAALELRVALRLERGGEHARSLRLPAPVRNPATLLKLIHLDLAAHPPQAPVVAAAVSAQPSKPRSTQDGLFVPPAPEPEKLELTLARIAGIVGQGNVGSPQLVDTHRPGAFRVASAFTGVGQASACPVLAFRAFRPPLAATVEGNPSPVFVAARGIRGKVLEAAGPWRTSGDWWTATPWARDDWDVALAGGALYRIYSEHFSGGWFVEGRYD